MLIVIDNYDSFVFNVVRYCAELGHPARVVRNNAVTCDEIGEMGASAIIISPGPLSPAEAGISLDVVRRYSGVLPILGVCLGHQCIGAAYGGDIVRAVEPMHGRASPIVHHGDGLFAGLAMPLTVGRYHSLVIRETPEMASAIEVTARTATGEIMALAHRTYPTFGVQFHPESILSEDGHGIFANFFALANAWTGNAVA